MLSFILFLSSFGFCYTIQSWEINEKFNTTTVFGDMMLTPLQLQYYNNNNGTLRNIFVKETSTNRWKNNVIPFILSNKYQESEKKIIRDSFKMFEKKTCFNFIERTREEDYLYIDALDGCYSYVGKTGGRQLLSLAIDCLADYIIWHEIMHAIGFEHEHQRPDRDNFIKVVYENVDVRQLGNFEKLNKKNVDSTEKYDYSSIMHYDGYAFGKMKGNRRLATMIPLKKNIALIDNTMLSSLDIKKLNRLAKCSPKDQTEVSSSLEEVSCQDHDSSCLYMKSKGLCDSRVHRSTMHKLCPKSCGLCDLRSFSFSQTVQSIATKICEDADPRCSIYASNGFCTDPFYEPIRKRRCAKSCNLC